MDPFGAGLSPFAYHTNVLAGILSYQMPTKKRSKLLIRLNPKAKSPEGDFQEASSEAIRDDPKLMFAFCARKRNGKERRRKGARQ